MDQAPEESGVAPLRGTLCLTGHHLLLSPGLQMTSELWLRLLRSVAEAVRLGGDSGIITQRCKDLRVLQLEILDAEESLDIARSIEMAQLLSPGAVLPGIGITSFPFFYPFKGLRLRDAWHFHPPERYYKRTAREVGAVLGEANEDFSLSADDDALALSARFRRGGRFPVLSYHHALSGTVLLRSSQPLTGPQKRRRAEELLRAGLAGARPGARGFIVDTRSAQAAKQARVTDAGTEAKAAYRGWKRRHRPLERGRPPQESFMCLVEACGDLEQSIDHWLSRLEGCHWLPHVKEALSTTCLAAQGMEREGACILVHGAEGTDSTLLVTSLAQLILDPLSRTMAGIQELVERDWIQVSGHLAPALRPPSRNPASLCPWLCPLPRPVTPSSCTMPTWPSHLFLDCVWQLGRQFPLSLEFGEGLLLALFEHAYPSPFGTFLCNRRDGLCEVRTRTHFLWSGLNQPKEQRRLWSPIYTPSPLAIWPSVEPWSLRLWQGLFLRWICPPEPSGAAWEKGWQIVTDKEKTELLQPSFSLWAPTLNAGSLDSG
uniref:Myotubularin phosphatase domain-containing protein n=1 Tax=Suricata suricatta TaxID=37032 RepID=A0A673TWM2_SURSU